MLEADALNMDWTKARNRARRLEVKAREKNLFSGESTLKTAKICEVPVLKLSVHPRSLDQLNTSHVVHHQHSWQPVTGKLNPPLALDWQESKDGRFDIFFSLPARVRCLGLGERFSTLDLRGAKHTLCTTDETKHTEFADSLYKAIPFMMVFDGDNSYGLLVDSPAPQRWDLDSELGEEGKIELFTREGFELYLFGPAPIQSVLKAYCGLTGTAKMPPLWSLGHQQCRWSYPDEETVREIANEFRARKIPCDTIYLDIDYMDEYRVFTSSKLRFPNFTEMVKDLRAQNFNVVTIIDPGVKQDEKYEVYNEGVKKDLFCKTIEGEVYIGQVWPGHSAFPDFLKEETRNWWAKQHEFYTKQGIAGIWNDMNEPSLFNWNKPLPEKMDALPTDSAQQFCHTVDGKRLGHLEARNLYGTLMCKSTHQGLLELKPNERTFVLTRSATAGIQNYAAVWLGDNYSWYEHMAKSIPMLLNMSMSGVAFCGVDIGGFFGDCSPEMLIRWYEVGVFYPLFRNHCWLEGRAQEPFAYSEETEAKCKKLIELRYTLLPYIYSLFWEHAREATPIMRPLLWHFPTDPIACSIDDQFLLGRDIMVAPVTERAKSYRNVYFPEGDWYPLSGGDHVRGGKSVPVETPLGGIPAFVRGGSIIPMAGPMQSTVEYGTAPITFKSFGNDCEGAFVEDDGKSFDYEKGKYNQWTLKQTGDKIEARVIHKSFSGVKREYFAEVGAKTHSLSLE